jgi:hypothetical protein
MTEPVQRCRQCGSEYRDDYTHELCTCGGVLEESQFAKLEGKNLATKQARLRNCALCIHAGKAWEEYPCRYRRVHGCAGFTDPKGYWL